MKLFNEISVSIYLYMTLLLSYCTESSQLDIDHMRLSIGWAITTLIGFVTTVNLTVFIANSFMEVLRRAKIKRGQTNVV